MTDESIHTPEPIRQNGLVIDPETGEIIGTERDPIHGDPFRPRTLEEVEWTLQRLHEAEADVEAAVRRKQVLLVNIEAMQREAQSRADFLRYRFSGDLETFLRRTIEGTKKRSLKTPWGTLSLRKTQPKIVVRDEETAVKWCEEHEPEAVKHTAKVLVSRLAPEQVTAGSGLEIEAAGESFAVKTGFGG